MRWGIVWAAFLLGSVLASDTALAGNLPGPTRRAYLTQDVPRLSVPPAVIAQSETTTVSCFEGQLSVLLNPGCFVTADPPQPGDCISTADHFMVQYLFPDWPAGAASAKILGFGFLNNDADTVYPSAGLIVIPLDNQGRARFPLPEELANLQVQNVGSATDTSEAYVDLSQENIVVDQGAGVALVLALQFPATGELVDVGVGPGIAVDADLPDQVCDLFTIDAGASWFEPAPCSDTTCEPLDWGFVLLIETDPVSAENVSWSAVKILYRTP
jgi:hypothetical protein